MKDTLLGNCEYGNDKKLISKFKSIFKIVESINFVLLITKLIKYFQESVNKRLLIKISSPIMLPDE